MQDLVGDKNLIDTGEERMSAELILRAAVNLYQFRDHVITCALE
ncbi:MAG: hypothetical protein PVG39_20590 [Desulfobacteraceae bacterium]